MEKLLCCIKYKYTFYIFFVTILLAAVITLVDENFKSLHKYETAKTSWCFYYYFKIANEKVRVWFFNYNLLRCFLIAYLLRIILLIFCMFLPLFIYN